MCTKAKRPEKCSFIFLKHISPWPERYLKNETGEVSRDQRQMVKESKKGSDPLGNQNSKLGGSPCAQETCERGGMSLKYSNIWTLAYVRLYSTAEDSQ